MSVSLTACQWSILSDSWTFASSIGEKWYPSTVLIYISLAREIEHLFYIFRAICIFFFLNSSSLLISLTDE